MPRVANIVIFHVLFLSIICCCLPAVSFSQNSPNSDGALELKLNRQQERQINTVVWLALIPILIAFAFMTFVFYRRKREAFFKQTEAELKLSKAEVEIKALKAQINPHFIFNCMNSIHHYMHKNDIKKAGDYLIKFSQLIRMVLENSSRDTITLKEDLHALRLYIQLEQMRLENRFDFEITVDESINQDNCEVPALLIQPFVENAIWHELTKVEEQGQLTVSIMKKDEGVLCIVRSNGTGRTQQPISTTLTDGITKTSMGMALISERLDLINRMSSGKAYFSSKDISEHEMNKYGHEVEVYIPVKDSEL
jgi:LytS/YehU family sensor histidine kinase